MGEEETEENHGNQTAGIFSGNRGRRNDQQATRTLHMTQPPLSYQMKMLEEELQVQLFIRGSKKIRLTEAGKALYVRAESLLTMTDITKREVIKVSQATTIHLG